MQAAGGRGFDRSLPGVPHTIRHFDLRSGIAVSELVVLDRHPDLRSGIAVSRECRIQFGTHIGGCAYPTDWRRLSSVCMHSRDIIGHYLYIALSHSTLDAMVVVPMIV